MTFFIALFILLMQFIWLYIDDMLGKGIEWYVIAELLFYSTANLVQYALPLSILLASLMTFGNLGEHYELVSFKAAGISLQQIMKPLFIFVFIISVAAFFFANNIMPIANLKFYSLLHDVRSQKPAINIKPNIFYNEIDGYSIRIKGKHEVGSMEMLEDIMIYDHTGNDGNRKVTVADSGVMRISEDKNYFLMELYNGVDYQEEKESGRNKIYPLTRFAFQKNEVRISLEGFNLDRTDERLFKNDYRMLNLAQLNVQEDSLVNSISNRGEDSFNRIADDYQLKTSRKDSLQQKQDTTANYLRFDHLNRTQMNRIYIKALSNVRSAKGRIAAAKIEVEQKQRRMALIKAEWHKKITLSLACLIMFFIGAPLGAIVRKGGLGMPVVISVIFFIVFWVLSMVGEKMVKEMVLLPYQGMWLSTVVLFPLGFFFTYMATTDSTIFNVDFYSNFFKKLFQKKAESK